MAISSTDVGVALDPVAMLSAGAVRGVRLRLVSRERTINHHPFFYIPAYDDAMRWLFFAAQKGDGFQAFGEIRSERRILQLTRRNDLNDWSLHPSHDGRYLYYTAGADACRVNLDTLREEVLVNFGDSPMLAPGMVQDAMGTTSLSHDDRWWVVPVRQQDGSRLYVINTSTGECNCLVEGERIFHPEFHPQDSSLIRYSGPYHNRIWVVDRDGAGNRAVYRRSVARKEWTVHEVWIPHTREMLVVDWRRGLFRLDIDTGLRVDLTPFNAWHPMVDRAGTRAIADTRNPDRGLHLVDLSTGDAKLVCPSQASSRGDHWDRGYCPYDDGPVQVEAPQHTHPHPSFSPDGRFVVFTTDVAGWPAVIEAELPR